MFSLIECCENEPHLALKQIIGQSPLSIKNRLYMFVFLFCFLSVVFLNDLYFSFVREKVKACFSVML